jgi:sporadic carbohydrate cluster 2OG-Fe(II) oxygenase|tara:strand:+ start:480 stop:1277 length:798 start_codon:yes stop_codon:yes gene_type:complete
MSFISQGEKKISEEFLLNGFVIKKSCNIDSLDKIRNEIIKISSEENLVEREEISNYLNSVHNKVSIDKINNFRLNIFNNLNDKTWLRESYFNSANDYLNDLVGNELCMQRRISLSIQLPNDKSSLLALHSDVWSGDSPYEVVLWIPLVDCYEAKSMYILPPEYSKIFYKEFPKYNEMSTDEIFEAVKHNLLWIDIKYGEILIFDQSLPHGNIVNDTNETRWSMNCRFKSVFSPYGDKKLGEFFDPISLKAATKMGMKYESPKIKF